MANRPTNTNNTMAAPGLTKLIDKLNIAEIQVRNVLIKSVCCGVTRQPQDDVVDPAAKDRQQEEVDRQIMKSDRAEGASGQRDVDYVEDTDKRTPTPVTLTNTTDIKPLTSQSTPANL